MTTGLSALCCASQKRAESFLYSRLTHALAVISYFAELPQKYELGAIADAGVGLLLSAGLNKLLPKLGISPSIERGGVSVTVNPPVLLGPDNGNGLLIDVTIIFSSVGSFGLAQDVLLATTLSSVALLAGDNLLALVLKPFAYAACEVVCAASSACVNNCRAAHIQVVPLILTLDFACPPITAPPSNEKKKQANEQVRTYARKGAAGACCRSEHSPLPVSFLTGGRGKEEHQRGREPRGGAERGES